MNAAVLHKLVQLLLLQLHYNVDYGSGAEEQAIQVEDAFQRAAETAGKL